MSKIFTDICYDLTDIPSFGRLIALNYLAPLIPKRTGIELDVSEVTMSRGDYNQGKLQKCVDKQEITLSALKESLELGFDRNCWKVFCSGIEHCEHVSDMLNSLGISSTFIHSKLTEDERDSRFDAFKTGLVKALCTNNIATTGFDHPPIDFIIDLGPTTSVVKHVQKYSRGTRPYDCFNTEQYIIGFDYVKRNCLVADFAGNVKRLGPINDPIIPRKKGDKTGEAPIKICEAVQNGQVCGIYNHASARFCGGKPHASDEGCGAEFVFKSKLLRTSGTDEIIRGDMPTIETFDVQRVIYHRHVKVGSTPSIKVTYYTGLIDKFSEYVCLEAKGYAKTRAINWWYARHASAPPETTDEALTYVSQLRVPKRIRVQTDLKYPEIKGIEW